MKFSIIKVKGFEILEIYRNNIFEYYIKPYDKNNYIFAFGVMDRFTDCQLITLAENGYFDNFEEV